MYNIGICDDGKNTCAAIEEMILQYAEKNKFRMDIQVWYAGEELCQYLEQGGHLDILFLDIHLGEENGLELLKELKEKSSDTRIIMVTADNGEETLQTAISYKADAFVTKPFLPQHIITALAS